MARRFFVFPLALALFGTGCFIFDDTHLMELSDGGGTPSDAGPDRDGAGGDAGEDGGPQGLDDRCGEPNPSMVVARTRQDILIDTTELTNQVTSSCGGAPTIGNDAFIGIDVQAGEYWHFHLRNDPSDPMSVSRAPAVYMLYAPTGSCDARDCRFSSDVCSDSGDEHFAFVADEDGRWFLGIDDRVAGGGRYLLDAIRPVCGDSIRDHGESCDDGNADLGDGCTPNCLRELTTELPSEIEPNDNPTEANYLVLDTAGEFLVEGAIGGPGVCRYGDSFAVDVPAGSRLLVDVLKTDGTPCDDPSLTTGYSLAIRNSAGADVVSAMTDASGCAVANTMALSGGLYYLIAFMDTELDLPVPYRLRTRVVP